MNKSIVVLILALSCNEQKLDEQFTFIAVPETSKVNENSTKRSRGAAAKDESDIPFDSDASVESEPLIAAESVETIPAEVPVPAATAAVVPDPKTSVSPSPDVKPAASVSPAPSVSPVPSASPSPSVDCTPSGDLSAAGLSSTIDKGTGLVTVTAASAQNVEIRQGASATEVTMKNIDGVVIGLKCVKSFSFVGSSLADNIVAYVLPVNTSINTRDGNDNTEIRAGADGSLIKVSIFTLPGDDNIIINAKIGTIEIDGQPFPSPQ